MYRDFIQKGQAVHATSASTSKTKKNFRKGLQNFPSTDIAPDWANITFRPLHISFPLQKSGTHAREEHVA